jgi:hypothetical protein
MKCNCGSGQDSWWRHDARGIPLCRVCEECEQEKIAKYRRDVLTDTNYWADEQIESQ